MHGHEWVSLASVLGAFASAFVSHLYVRRQRVISRAEFDGFELRLMRTLNGRYLYRSEAEAMYKRIDRLERQVDRD